MERVPLELHAVHGVR